MVCQDVLPFLIYDNNIEIVTFEWREEDEMICFEIQWRVLVPFLGLGYDEQK